MTEIHNDAEKPGATDLQRNERGAVGYMLAWFMGIPASVLFLIFLLRGCN